MMRRLAVRAVLAAALWAAVSAAVLPAFGAPGSAVQSAGSVPQSLGATGTIKNAPVVPAALDVQLILDGEPGQVVGITGFVIAPAVKLPAMVRVPLPAGSRVTWAGEILSQTGQNDTQRPYRVVRGVGGDVLEMTVEVSHNGQIETVAAPLTQNGRRISAKYQWVQSATAASEQFGIRFPPNASAEKMSPAAASAPATNQAGETLYPLPKVKLALGESYPITISYTASPEVPAAQSPAAASSQQVGSVGAVLPWLFAGLVVAAIALAVAFSAQRRRRNQP